MTKSLTISCLFCALLGHMIFAQPAPSTFNESIQLHVNSSFLEVGESLLFKIYCLNAATNKTSNLSSIAYVELIDEKTLPVLQTKIALKDGFGFGDFFLPSSLSTGNYTLIAYTNWMRNLSQEGFFRTQLSIINPFKKPLSNKQGPLIEFFPEGGKIISGVNNTIGFRLKETKRKQLRGQIVDENGNILVTFSPMIDGLGKFNLLPVAGKEYKALIRDSVNNIYLQPLPRSVDKGIAIQVTETEDRFDIALAGSPDKKNAEVVIYVRHKSEQIVESKIVLENGTASYKIKKAVLPSGVSTISVRSQGGIECERNIFKPFPVESGFHYSFEKKILGPRENAKISLVMKDSSVANLSISVRKIENTIDAPISKSEFNDTFPNLLAASENEILYTDLFLLNSKTFYRSGNQPVTSDPVRLNFLPEVRGSLLTGRVIKNNSGSIAAGQMVYFSVPGKNYFFAVSSTDSSGRFYFNNTKIKFDTESIIQINPATCADCEVVTDNFGLSDYSLFKPNEIQLDATLKELIEHRSIASQIENAYFEVKHDSLLDDPTPPRFYGKPDFTYRLDDYVRFPTMEDVLIEYVNEIVIRKKGNQFEIRVKDNRKRDAFEKDPLILVNGVPVFDLNKFMSMDPLLVEKIEIVGTRYFYGSLETQGIISVATYDGTDKNVALLKKEKYKGIQPQKKYFSPAYDGRPAALAKIPDYRIQLYWNPAVVVSNQPSSIHFFTSDVTGVFEVIFKGIRNDGQPIYSKEIIEVK
jgi:hypothetical protein